MSLKIVRLQNVDSVLFSFKGFMQLYQLQTENEEKETWKDLVSFPLWRGCSFTDCTLNIGNTWLR